MEQTLHIQQELKDIAPKLLGLNANVFNVPNGYFNNVAGGILAKIEILNSNYLKANTTAFAPPPAQYFDELPNLILQKIKAQNQPENKNELTEMAPTLATISKQNVYSVPVNYFQNISYTKALHKPAKIVSIKSVMQYASAAVVIGILCIVGFKTIGSQNIKKQYIVAKQVNIEKSVTKIATEELQKGVASTVIFNTSTSETSNVVEQKLLDVSKVLQNVKDEELESYLKQNSFVSEEEEEVSTGRY